MRRHDWTARRINALIADLAAITIPTPGELRLSVVPEDPSDDRYLECAIEAGAEYLVTVDRLLLQLREYRSVKIVAPREFLTRLQNESSP